MQEFVEEVDHKAGEAEVSSGALHHNYFMMPFSLLQCDEIKKRLYFCCNDDNKVMSMCLFTLFKLIN